MIRLKQLARFLSTMLPWTRSAQMTDEELAGWIVIHAERGDIYLNGVSAFKAEETLRLCLARIQEVNGGNQHQCNQIVH